MAEVTKLALHPNFLGEEIFVSREVTEVTVTPRSGQKAQSYREYTASSRLHPSFVIRVTDVKHAPKPTQRQKVILVDPQLTYITERNVNRRPLDIPIVIAKTLRLVKEDKK